LVDWLVHYRTILITYIIRMTPDKGVSREIRNSLTEKFTILMLFVM